MKVAVSVPNDIFAETDALAKQLKTSRSKLRVSELMNAVVREVGNEPQTFSLAANRRVLKKTKW